MTVLLRARRLSEVLSEQHRAPLGTPLPCRPSTPHRWAQPRARLTSGQSSWGPGPAGRPAQLRNSPAGSQFPSPVSRASRALKSHDSLGKAQRLRSCHSLLQVDSHSRCKASHGLPRLKLLCGHDPRPHQVSSSGCQCTPQLDAATARQTTPASWGSLEKEPTSLAAVPGPSHPQGPGLHLGKLGLAHNPRVG